MPTEKVFFRGGPLHALNRTLRGSEAGTPWITDPGAGHRSSARYRRTDERYQDAVVYQYEEATEEPQT